MQASSILCCLAFLALTHQGVLSMHEAGSSASKAKQAGKAPMEAPPTPARSSGVPGSNPNSVTEAFRMILDSPKDTDISGHQSGGPSGSGSSSGNDAGSSGSRSGGGHGRH
ncbi:hypothetical protein PGT21_032186 [Puccinia graminis f. sp. tritici]|uniref:Uncharacterized protein n=1 Tax=Puccinia graminis f. sp. tritici TaxID=56615 RepID=A0A5B0S0A9_PUCGR|nr:hypothetical protein PGT21_032186 [Puccinia graminis f. sp. tritici]KAA1130204.1 hypothetical protein PGTUg99_005053 [Puccinia graminis f. sp. tritici]